MIKHMGEVIEVAAISAVGILFGGPDLQGAERTLDPIERVAPASVELFTAGGAGLNAELLL